MWLLVTGTGRCGTGFMSRLLTSAGVRCTHEGVFTMDGIDAALERIALRRGNPSWKWKADSSWLAAPFLFRPELCSLTVVHLVRHPKQVIDSHLRLMLYNPGVGPYYRWMASLLPELDEMPTPEDRSALWYIRLNEMCERRADMLHKIEDAPGRILTALGIQHEEKTLFCDAAYNTRVGLGPSDVSLDDISSALRSDLLEMCERYGYKWDDVKRTSTEASWIRGIKVPIPETAAAIGGGWQLRSTNGEPVVYDAPLIEFFAQQVSQVPGAVVVDVGASTGSFSILPLVTDCRVVAYEPNPRAAKELRKVVEMNGLLDRVEVHEIALGDEAGTITLHVPTNAVHMAVATTGIPRREDLDWRDVEIETQSLDTLQLDRLDFLKVDVEGAELPVLHGAEQTIKTHRPGILVEYTSLNTRQCGYDREKIKATLEQWGYTTFRQVGLEDLWCES